jgi:hypothetical protein
MAQIVGKQNPPRWRVRVRVSFANAESGHTALQHFPELPSTQVSIMSNSSKSGASDAKNHPFVSETPPADFHPDDVPTELRLLPHVVLKHRRAGSRKGAPHHAVEYMVGALFLYCEAPPADPELTLFGIYPTLDAALAAVQVDRGYPASPLLGVRS